MNLDQSTNLCDDIDGLLQKLNLLHPLERTVREDSTNSAQNVYILPNVNVSSAQQLLGATEDFSI
uniref:Uncharacterized protein n=1 Tax=Arundo donax TaxID=35708 RepID=A0A0A9EAM3_ARUDO